MFFWRIYCLSSWSHLQWPFFMFPPKIADRSYICPKKRPKIVVIFDLKMISSWPRDELASTFAASGWQKAPRRKTTKYWGSFSGPEYIHPFATELAPTWELEILISAFECKQKYICSTVELIKILWFYYHDSVTCQERLPLVSLSASSRGMADKIPGWLHLFRQVWQIRHRVQTKKISLPQSMVLSFPCCKVPIVSYCFMMLKHLNYSITILVYKLNLKFK